MKNYRIKNILLSAIFFPVLAALAISCGGASSKKKEHDGLFLIDKATGDFYIDRSGKKVFDCPAYNCGEFSEGIAAARSAGSDEPTKFIDKTGKVLFEGKYESVKPFSEGLAVVGVKDPNGGTNKKFGAIDKTGKMVIEAKYDDLEPFSDGLAAVGMRSSQNAGYEFDSCTSCKYGYLDNTGKVVIPIELYKVKPFSDGFALVLKDDRAGEWRFIDKTGKDTGWYEKHRYAEAMPFSEGFAAIEDAIYGWTFINTKGEKAFELQDGVKFEEVRPFSEGWAAVKLDSESKTENYRAARPWTFINTSGKLREGVTSFEEAGDFSEGFAAVKSAGKWSYIKPDETDTDDLGKKARFEKAEPYSGGLAAVEIMKDDFSKKKAFLDTTGKRVWEEE